MAQYLDIIILLLVVILLFQKLRSLLGTRPTETEKKIAEEKAAKIFDMIVQKAEAQKHHTKPTTELEATPIKDDSELSETDKVLSKIPNFNKNHFLNSAKKAIT